MEHKRVFLITAIFLVAMLMWNAWKEDYAVKDIPITSAANVAQSLPSAIPDGLLTQSTSAQRNVLETASISQTSTSGNRIEIDTDVLHLIIDEQGANMVQASLKAYSTSLSDPSPVVLLTENPGYRYSAQGNLIERSGNEDLNQVTYSTEKNAYQLATGQNQLTVDFNWTNPEGVTFTKRYLFTRGKYDIDVQYRIHNASPKPWQGFLITQLLRTDRDPYAKKGFFNIHAYFGASYSTKENPYNKVTFKDMSKKNVMDSGSDGWIAMQQHYFLTAWIPENNVDNLFFTKALSNNLYTIGARGPQVSIAPGTTTELSTKFYVGPELTEQLKLLAPHLNMTVDYGWLWMISDTLFWLLQKIYSLIGNWGWAIVILTVLIKLILHPLSAVSYRSMSKMRKLQPKIKQLKERYGEDRQKMTQETMALYKRENVNPFGGCLPILVQIPVFIALYWVLVESVQLRQAPFILWIHDLSIKDPYFILPLLMGASMFIQQRLNPAPPDPTQAKVMMMLPIVFTILFASFPAGLVLYWVVNNSISIIQQWYIMRGINEASSSGPKKKTA